MTQNLLLAELEKWKEYLLLERKFSSHTISAYHRDVLSFVHLWDEMGSLPAAWTEVRKQHIRESILYLQEQGMSSKTINRKLSALKSCIAFLQEIEVLPSDFDALTGIRSLKTRRNIPHYFTPQEIQQVLDMPVWEDTFWGKQDKLMLLVLFSLGIRRSELIAIQLSDFSEGYAVVRITGKGNKERQLYCTPELQQAIEEFVEAKRQRGFEDKNTLFITKKGKPLYPKFVYSKIKHYLSFIDNGSKKSPHILRHSLATALLNSGADIMSIQKTLGHESVDTTQVYTHNAKERIQKAYLKFHPRNS